MESTEGMSEVIESFTDAAGDVAGNAIDVVVQVVPIALPIVGAVLICVLGFRLVKKFFKG